MRWHYCAVAALAASVTMDAQSIPVADSSQKFEVAAIKKNVSDESGAQVLIQPDGSISVRNNSLYNIVRNAYGVQRYQIVPGTRTPEWFDRDRWDILAKPPSRDVTNVQRFGMLQNLLAERFKLVVLRERRELDAYALVLDRADGRLGPQLRVSNGECDAQRKARDSGTPPASLPPVTRGFCGTRANQGTVSTSGVPVADLARNLAPLAGRLVIDRTGLTGPYDADLQWTPDQQPLAGAPPTAQTDGTSVFAALREQLGLKLEPTRTPVEVLVIESAERPDEN